MVRSTSLRGPGILLFQAAALNLHVQLLALWVDACAGSVEEPARRRTGQSEKSHAPEFQKQVRNDRSPLDALNTGDLEHVEADHRVVVHDHGVVGLNEAHACSASFH